MAPPASQVTTQVLYCFHCGRKLPIEANFCPYCGTKVHQTHHDEKGLTLPHPAAPFDVYLMQVPGKELDTRAKADEIYMALKGAGIPVLFDDRDERAGVKFNDADLIGCPLRVTVGEKGLKEGMVELKPRRVKENQLVPVDEIVEKIKSILN
jgi:prolyl-tRNA synthetase